jgi:hypothetical protein
MSMVLLLLRHPQVALAATELEGSKLARLAPQAVVDRGFGERSSLGAHFMNAPPPKGGGFDLRLKAGLVRLWRTQVTLKSSSGSGGV